MTRNSAALTFTSLAALLMVSACSGAQVAPQGAPAPAQRVTDFESWRSMILAAPKPQHGCLIARYPQSVWRQTRCVKPPNEPLLPARGIRRGTVGDGVDFLAAVTGRVSLARGSFLQVSGVTSEYVHRRKHRIPNRYSLQINTQFFTTSSCATLGSPDPGQCFGWEQFVYDASSHVTAFIEYWLVDFGPQGTACPSQWHPFSFAGSSEVNCWVNSADAIPLPVQPVTALEKLDLSGAVAGALGSTDAAVLSVAGTAAYYVNGDNWFPDLNEQWQDAEFNVFGNSDGDEAYFNAGSTIVVRTEVDSGAATAPSCSTGGFTGETNNLTLTATRRRWPKAQYPSVVFEESNAVTAPASCATEKAQK